MTSLPPNPRKQTRTSPSPAHRSRRRDLMAASSGSPSPTTSSAISTLATLAFTPNGTNLPSSWWESVTKARSAILSLSSFISLSVAATVSSLADSDRPALSLLSSSAAYGLVSLSLSSSLVSESGSDPICHWLYDTYLFSGAAPSPATALQTAMARLEDEFRQILVTRSLDIEIDSLIDLVSLSINNSSVSSELFPGNGNLTTEVASDSVRSPSPSPSLESPPTSTRSSQVNPSHVDPIVAVVGLNLPRNPSSRTTH